MAQFPCPGPNSSITIAAGSPETARALWVQEGNEYRREYLDLLQHYHGADAFVVDFSTGPGQALERINAWAVERTQGTITALLDEGMVHAGTELVVTDVIRFSGKWLEPFDPEDTRNRAFRTNRGETVQTPFMHGEADVRALALEEGDTIGIPFDAGTFSLIILLPREGADLAAIEEGMTHEGLARLLGRLAGSPQIRAKLSLPRFVVKDGRELADTLGLLGMRTAFTQEADFSGITSQKNLVLTAVVHKAFLEVREEGVEEAAGSGAAMAKGSGAVAAFVADRPFVFVIRENKTGLFLFLGRFVDPRD
ncbi:MAG: serpin family protein [Desulfomonilia bacterium]